MDRRWGFEAVLLGLTLGLGGCAAPVSDEEEEPVSEQVLAQSCASDFHPGYIQAKGAFTCDFRIAGDYPPQQLPPDLERDRMHMTRADGMLHKQIPIAFSSTEFTNGFPDIYGGGRYLFEKWSDARDYHEFVAEDFVLDGVQFLERSYLSDADCHHYKVVNAYRFKPIDTAQVVVRTERFEMTGHHAVQKLQHSWGGIWAEAKQRDMAAVWLMYNAQEDIASVVYFIDRVVPYDPNVPDFATLGFLASSPPLGHHLEERGFSRTFDRTQWVLTVWFPFKKGDHGQPSEWPHSPPFGRPYCTDGVCEVSAGENATSCPADCRPHCGNAICQPGQGENDLNCPGDCGYGPSN